MQGTARNRLIFSDTPVIFRMAVMLLIGVCLFTATSIWANVLKVEVDCPYEQVVKGAQFAFDVKVTTDGASPPQPDLKPLPTLDVVPVSGFHSTQIVNNRVTQVFRYRAVAKQSGDLVLDGITAGGVAATPVTIKVLDRPPEPQPGESRPPVFIETTVTKNTVWQGEQIVFDFDIYYRTPRPPVNLQADIEAALNQFMTHRIDTPNGSKTTHVGGERYNRITAARYILFPLEPGTFRIPPIRLHGQTEVEQDRERDDPFDMFFSFRRRVEPLERVCGGPVFSQPIDIEVKPLPAQNRPANFSGAVGQYRIKTNLERTTSRVGEPITLTLEVTGNGNQKSIAEPALNLPEWMELYTTERQTSTNMQAGKLYSNVRYDFMLIPRQEGQVEIPAIEFVFFDPASGQYVTITDGPFPLTVEPGESQTVAYMQGKRKRIRVTGRDFRHIHTPAELVDQSRAVWQTKLFWLALLGPWLLVAMACLKRWQENRLANNPVLRNRIRARKEIQRLLDQASAEQGKDIGRYCGILENALHEHLSALLGHSSRGQLRNNLRDELLTRADESGLEPNQYQQWVEEVLELLDTLDQYRFAAATLSPNDLETVHAQAKTLLGRVPLR